MTVTVESTKNIEKYIVKCYRDLHQIPELHDELIKTTQYIRDRLDELGIKYDIYPNSGIRGIIDSGRNGPVLAFRADMDALPIVEETGLEFSAKGEFMHACGHDAHSAMLLGAAKILKEMQSELTGKVVLLFQPAEETTGGAKIMIENGCMRDPDVDRFISFHTGSLFEGFSNGMFGWKKGPLMAAVDSFTVKIVGKGGHGARPSECIDPIPISCEIIQALQRVISRELKPVHGAVITVGLIHAGTIVNVIPDIAMFGGTIRTLDEEDRNYVRGRLPEIIDGIAKAHRAKAEVDLKPYYPVTVNNEEVTEFLAESAKKVLGDNNVAEISEPSTGTEDVAYYLQEASGSYGFFASSAPHTDGLYYPVHNSKFRVDESILYLGSAIYVQCAVDYLIPQ